MHRNNPDNDGFRLVFGAPPPWLIEENYDACFIVRDSTGQAARLNFANLIIDAAKTRRAIRSACATLAKQNAQRKDVIHRTSVSISGLGIELDAVCGHSIFDQPVLRRRRRRRHRAGARSILEPHYRTGGVPGENQGISRASDYVVRSRREGAGA